MAVDAICVTENRSPSIVYGPLIELQPPLALTSPFAECQLDARAGDQSHALVSVERKTFPSTVGADLHQVRTSRH